jgi:hypothetical protein
VLGQRAATLRDQLADLENGLTEFAFLPRVVLMDDEYARALYIAELAWLESVIADLRNGSLTWSYEDFAELAGQVQPYGVPSGVPASGVPASAEPASAEIVSPSPD